MTQGMKNVFFNQLNGIPLQYEDPLEKEKELLKSNFKDHYHNLGLISGETKMNHLKTCDIFVLPSYSEGFSRSMVEAMSMGKPIVYTPVGAHKEVMKNRINGIGVFPGNLDELSSAIIELVENRQLNHKISKNNYQYVRDKFDIQIIVSQLIEYFDTVLDQ